MDPLRFSARVITGSGRGKTLGTPTLNLHMQDVPVGIEEGIYAARTQVDGVWHATALHYGPRPVFKDTPSCEAYLLDTVLETAPEHVEIELIAYLRPVLDFPSVEALQAQIAADVEATRGIVGAHGSTDS